MENGRRARRTRTYRGASTQGDNPNWRPLVDAIGEELTGYFMWMFEVELSDGRLVQAYKHITTRRYVHLDEKGRAFVYIHPDRYQSMPLLELLRLVLPAVQLRWHLLQCVEVADRTIPQRELRNNISAVLRAAEAGETFTVTVRGRAVARVIPPGDPGQPRTDVDRAALRRILAEPLDDDLGAELDAAEAPVDDPWPAA